jgi:hypothetical protein
VPTDRGQASTRVAKATLAKLEAELAQRLGRQQVQALRQALEADWGPTIDGSPGGEPCLTAALGAGLARDGRGSGGRRGRGCRTTLSTNAAGAAGAGRTRRTTAPRRRAA